MSLPQSLRSWVVSINKMRTLRQVLVISGAAALSGLLCTIVIIAFRAGVMQRISLMTGPLLPGAIMLLAAGVFAVWALFRTSSRVALVSAAIGSSALGCILCVLSLRVVAQSRATLLILTIAGVLAFQISLLVGGVALKRQQDTKRQTIHSS
jgi:hypothetical protein